MQEGAANVAILIFDGVQIIDYAGPYEAFGQSMLNVYTVADKPGPITSNMGLSINPKYTIKDCPKPDILIIPGGNIDAQLENEGLVRWVKDHAERARFVLSICNGAFLLARAGVLDGLEATTRAALIEQFRKVAPNTNVITDRRFVDNGRVITSGGLSAGIDASLHVIARLFSKGWAQAVALSMEYDWDPESRFAVLSLADKYLRPLGGVDPNCLSWEGSADYWQKVWITSNSSSRAEVLDGINTDLVTIGKWSKQGSSKEQIQSRSLWRFAGEGGSAWNGSVSVEPVRDKNDSFMVTVRIAREGAFSPWRLDESALVR